MSGLSSIDFDRILDTDGALLRRTEDSCKRSIRLTHYEGFLP